MMGSVVGGGDAHDRVRCCHSCKSTLLQQDQLWQRPQEGPFVPWLLEKAAEGRSQRTLRDEARLLTSSQDWTVRRSVRYWRAIASHVLPRFLKADTWRRRR